MKHLTIEIMGWVTEQTGLALELHKIPASSAYRIEHTPEGGGNTSSLLEVWGLTSHDTWRRITAYKKAIMDMQSGALSTAPQEPAPLYRGKPLSPYKLLNLRNGGGVVKAQSQVDQLEKLARSMSRYMTADIDRDSKHGFLWDGSPMFPEFPVAGRHDIQWAVANAYLRAVKDQRYGYILGGRR